MRATYTKEKAGLSLPPTQIRHCSSKQQSQNTSRSKSLILTFKSSGQFWVIVWHSLLLACDPVDQPLLNRFILKWFLHLTLVPATSLLSVPCAGSPISTSKGLTWGDQVFSFQLLLSLYILTVYSQTVPYGNSSHVWPFKYKFKLIQIK